ncbi:MAG TPA: hypothetical protein PK147_05290, partial [Saprospiraceae bacterium]|nr:hypothetical protein [Saprospiraceae bacterium]
TITHEQTVTVEPKAEASFVNPPGDMTVSCENRPQSNSGASLEYDNGETGTCQIMGSISPIENYNADECGGNIIYIWQFTDDCGREISHNQTITVLPASQGQFTVLPPSNVTYECQDEPANGETLTIDNGESGDCQITATVEPIKVGDADKCGGSYMYEWLYVDACGRETSFVQTVNISPAIEALLETMPPNITIDCSEIDDELPELSYTNNLTGDCLIQGMISGIRSGDIDYCGGELLDNWEGMDECGRLISYNRIVTVNPSPAAQFVNPPGDITVNCEDVNSIPLLLSYSNGENGTCQIAGNVTANISGTYNSCGGTLIHTWTFIDLCGRSINHSRTVTVNSAPDPMFVNPPSDIEIACNETYSGPPNLPYSNGLSGSCGINGIVAAISNQTDNIITNTWEYISPCTSNSITHIQTVILSITPNISLLPSVIYLCEGQSFDLNDIEAIDLNNTQLNISFHSGYPTDGSNEIGPIIYPTDGSIVIIKATNEFDCEDSAILMFIVEPQPSAGDDNSTTICSEGAPVDLNDFLVNNVQDNGSWVDLDGSGVNLSDPTSVNFSNLTPGDYSLYYIVPGTTVCPNDTMILYITLIDDVSFDITNIYCINDNQSYEVYINSNGYDIYNTGGELVEIGGNQYVVTDIPIDDGIYITAFEPISGCFYDVYVQAPDCGCPNISPPPVSNLTICVYEQPYTFNLTLPSNQLANWYSDNSGTQLLLSGSKSYVIMDKTPGVYNYYVEAVDLESGCKSLTKTKMTVEIIGTPPLNSISKSYCDLSDDSIEIINLQSLNSLVNTNPTNTFSYYLNQSDAENEVNEITDNFDLSVGSNIIWVRVVNNGGCYNTTQLELILNNLPNVGIEVTPPICSGQNSGFIAISGSANILSSLDGIDFSAENIYDDLVSGDYTLYLKDQNGCENEINFSVDEGLQLDLNSFDYTCDDNGTSSNSSDDYYIFSWNLSTTVQSNTEYEVFLNANSIGIFQFGEDFNYNLPSDGSIVVFNFVDLTTNCTIEETTTNLFPCSTNCEIIIETLSYNCNDNNTPTNPNDDIAEIIFLCNALNGGTNQKFNLSIDGVLIGQYPYGIENTITWPADGQNISLLFQDNEILACTIEEIFGTLEPCSDECKITLNVSDINCNNNNTTTDASDDFYVYHFIVTQQNGNTLAAISVDIDNILFGNFNLGEEIEIIIPADDLVHTLQFYGQDNVNCLLSYITQDLYSCSTDCEMLINNYEESCNNAMTETNPDDDFYNISFVATAINAAVNNQFNLYIDNAFIGAYSYDEITELQIAADGLQHIILIRDSQILSCQQIINTQILNSCSNTCLLEATITNISCFDDGTMEQDDDYYEIALMVTGLNLGASSSFSIEIDGSYLNSYSYGENLVITLSADNSVHSVYIYDVVNSSCSTNIITSTLIPCSEPCEINAEILSVDCFNNGTNNTEEDDFFLVTLVANNPNGGEYLVDGNTEQYGTSMQFGPIYFNQSNIELQIFDVMNNNCNITLQLPALESCSECLQSIDAGEDQILDCNQPSVKLIGTSSDIGMTSWYGTLGNVISNTIDVTVSSVGTYTFEVSFSDGCILVDTVEVFADQSLPITSVSSSNNLTCKYNMALLSGSSNANNENYFYR